MNKEEREKQAEDYQAKMDHIGDVDDPLYQLYEVKRDACYSNAADAPWPGHE